MEKKQRLEKTGRQYKLIFLKNQEKSCISHLQPQVFFFVQITKSKFLLLPASNILLCFFYLNPPHTTLHLHGVLRRANSAMVRACTCFVWKMHGALAPFLHNVQCTCTKGASAKV